MARTYASRSLARDTDIDVCCVMQKPWFSGNCLLQACPTSNLVGPFCMERIYQLQAYWHTILAACALYYLSGFINLRRGVGHQCPPLPHSVLPLDSCLRA